MVSPFQFTRPYPGIGAKTKANSGKELAFILDNVLVHHYRCYTFIIIPYLDGYFLLYFIEEPANRYRMDLPGEYLLIVSKSSDLRNLRSCR